MENNLKTGQKITAIVLALIMIFGSYMPAKKANAQWSDIITEVETGLSAVSTELTSVYDDIASYAEDSIWIKDYILDPLAWAEAKGMLQSMTDSTVNWINSGFQGSPAFVQNPEQFFQKIGDNVAGNFIAGSGSPLAALCSPIALNVRLALALNQAGSSGGSGGSGSSNPYSCTLSSIINNVQNASISAGVTVNGMSIAGFEGGDFSQGGWPAFAALAEPQNSFYGAYLESEADLSTQIAQKTATNQKLLDQGNGFLSFQQCTPNPAAQGSSVSTGAQGSSVAMNVINNSLAINTNSKTSVSNSTSKKIAIKSNNNLFVASAINAAGQVYNNNEANVSQQQQNQDMYSIKQQTLQQDQTIYNSQCSGVTSDSSSYAGCQSQQAKVQQDQTSLNNFAAQNPSVVNSSDTSNSAPASSGNTAGCQLVDPDTGECLDNNSSPTVQDMQNNPNLVDVNGNYYNKTTGVLVGSNQSELNGGSNTDQNSTDNTSNTATSCDSEGNCTDSNGNSVDNTTQNSTGSTDTGISCDSEGNCTDSNGNSVDNTSYTPDQSTIPDAPPGAAGAAGETCTTVTPGSVISSSLNKALGSGQDSLVQASMLDEIIGALASKLVSTVLSSSGLSGVSQPSNGQPAYLTQIEAEAASSSAISGSLGGSLSTNLSQDITDATSIQSYASSSISWAEKAQAVLLNASSTCQSDGDTYVLSQISALITSTTTPLIAQFQTDYATITNGLDNLLSLKEQIAAATSTAKLASLTQLFQNLSSTHDPSPEANPYSQAVPSVSDVSNAKTENNTTQSLYNSLSATAATYVSQCYTYAHPANNGGFGF